MPLTIVAGYRPATTALGQWPEICVFSRTRLPRSYLEEGPCTLRRPNLTPRTSSGNHHANIESRRPQHSNPHRSRAPHRRAPSGPRFPPLRLLGRLPPEPTPPSVRGRHPRTLNKVRRGGPAGIRPLRTQNRTHSGRVGSAISRDIRPLLYAPAAQDPLEQEMGEAVAHQAGCAANGI